VFFSIETLLSFALSPFHKRDFPKRVITCCPMDPISLAASLLTVIGAAATAGRTLEKLSSARYAGDQLDALINEVKDLCRRDLNHLRLVLSNAYEAIRGRTETSKECGNLAHIVRRADQKMKELKRLIYQNLVQNGKSEGNLDKPKASRIGFIRHQRKIQSLKSELREIKLSLLATVGTLTLLDVSRLHLRICDVGLVASPNNLSIESAQSHNTPTEVESLPFSQKQADTQIHETFRLLESYDTSARVVNSDLYSKPGNQVLKCANTEKRLTANQYSTGELTRADTKEVFQSPQIRVETSSLPLNHCDRPCVCQCHRFTNLATPSALNQVVGRLFIGYVGLPLLSSSKCNRTACRRRRTQMEIRIAYLFPVWFVLRFIALTITKASTTFMWKLSVPVVTQTTAPMMVFTSLGDTGKIQALLGSDDGCLNAIDSVANKSALHVALQFRQMHIVSFLIQQGADMTPLDTFYENYFTTAGDLKMTALIPLFEKHDIFDHWNLSYIHLIVLGCSNMALSTYLSVSTESIDVTDSFGRTALMWAAWRGDSASVSVLLDFGANPQSTSFDGNSVLIYATYGGSPECLRLILGKGASISHFSHSLVTPAMGGSRLGDNPAIAKVRVDRGAAIEASRQQNFSPLYVAALTNNVECLSFLLDCGASVDVDTWNCSTPLSMAISFNNHRMAEELIRRGSDLSATSTFTTSYLRSAAVFGDEEMIRILSQARPAIDNQLEDIQGYTARDRMSERLRSMSPLDPRKERLADAFEELVEVCAAEFARTRCPQTQQVLMQEGLGLKPHGEERVLPSVPVLSYI
ncbi:MAG: hypothetical protein Q9214_004603, partial [Letrouitia sp. 1 TL-2023]